MNTTTSIVKKIALAAACVTLLSACAGQKYAFQQENFDAKGPFDRHFNAPKQVVFESMKRVALRQGFAVEQKNNTEHTLVVSKQYQEDERNTLLTISGLVTGGEKASDAWIAAQETTQKTNVATQTASIGLGLGLSVPVPTGKVSTLIKERGETIMDKMFYDKLYMAIEKEIPVVQSQLKTESHEDDSRMRSEIEKKLRIEMEIRAKLEKETQDRLKAAQEEQETTVATPATESAPAPAAATTTPVAQTPVPNEATAGKS